MIRLKNVSKTYKLGGGNLVHALKDVTLEIQKGEMVAIVGPSGSGKSTLLNILGCLDVPDNGVITIGGVDVVSKNDKEKATFRNCHIGFIFQNFNLIPVLNVYENVEFPFLMAERDKYQGRDSRIRQVIDEVGLTQYIHHRSNELSGGQMQRVAIARALAMEPLVILADEPTANIDSEISRTILDVMRHTNESQKTTFIIASHDPLITEYTSRKLVLKDGNIVSEDC
jgi:putative ABC transport system ATP-binding protein